MTDETTKRRPSSKTKTAQRDSGGQPIRQFTEVEQTALQHARHLAKHGVPIFIARPDPNGLGHNGTGYWLPSGWQQTEADPVVVDDWRPGMALAAVMGHAVDGLDVDAQKGGEDSRAMFAQPRSYGRQRTPSGGTHDLIASLGVRSRDGVLPGIDVKAGEIGGQGRGFLFIAPTVKDSKVTGQPVAYEWETPPDLTPPELLLDDNSGDELAELVRAKKQSATPAVDYDGPEYDDLTDGERDMAAREVDRRVDDWRARLADAAEWDEGETDDHGRGWEALSYQAAWTFAVIAATRWSGVDEQRAHELYDDVLPDAIAADAKCAGKWRDDLVTKAASQGATMGAPPWQDFDAEAPTDELLDPYGDSPRFLDDARLAPWVAWSPKALAGNWRYAKGLGWLHWTGGRWKASTDLSVNDAARRAFIDLHHRETVAAYKEFAGQELPKDAVARLDALHRLLSVGRAGAVMKYVMSAAEIDAADLDTRPDLLNVANGVVDLRTGELRPHDKELLLTKITRVKYVPGATHADWTQVLSALPPVVADWMQVRMGQAATGYMTPDDLLPILQGSGSNGKSTFLLGCRKALGQHAVQVPDRVLMSNPGDHPTELMTLRGARLATIEETPEAQHLNVQRLKATVGTPTMNARLIRKDNVQWDSTHSLMLASNYRPRVDESDHGTWRRLALVRFPYTFSHSGLRERVEAATDGQLEAALSWLVAGAVRWYAAGKEMPPMPAAVTDDTREWRGQSDRILAYVDDRLEFDPDACVTCSDLLADFNEWLYDQGSKTWAARTFNERFASHSEVERHPVERARPKNAANHGLVRRRDTDESDGRQWVWTGVRWKDGAT